MLQLKIEDIENKMQCFYEQMIIAKRNGNVIDQEKFQILYNSFRKQRDDYYNLNKQGGLK